MKRRQYLSIVSTAGILSISGCSSPRGSSGQFRVPAANVPSSRLQSLGWQQVDELNEQFTQSVAGGLIEIDVRQRTTIFEDIGLRTEVREKTLGNFDAALSMFFAARADLNPNLDNLPFGVGLAEIIDQTEGRAKDTFESKMRDSGLSNIRESNRGSLQVDTGETARGTVYSAEYEYAPISIPVPQAENITIPGGSLPVEGLLAVWHHGDYILVSGGAYPKDDFEERAETELTDAITVTIDIDLDLQPQSYREELLDLMAAVS